MVQRYLKLSVKEHALLPLGGGEGNIWEGVLLSFFNLFSPKCDLFSSPLIGSQEVINEENMPFPKSLCFTLITCTMEIRGTITNIKA